MILHTTMDGRPVIAAYFDDQFEPVDDEHAASVVEVTFTDDKGGVLFLVPKAHSDTKARPQNASEKRWAAIRARAQEIGQSARNSVAKPAGSNYISVARGQHDRASQRVGQGEGGGQVRHAAALRATHRRGRDEATSGADVRGCGRALPARRHVARGFDPNEPRDEHGRWTDGADDDVGAVWKPDQPHQDAARAAGQTPVTFHELHSAAGEGRFRDAITAARAAHPEGAAVEVKSPGEYAGMRTFVTPDNKAGFALHGDDIVSVFKHPDSTAKGFANSALALATQNGGRRLDAFDTVLPRIYSANGFRAVARLAWNDQYKPPGWDYQKFKQFNGGRPDVVFMVHDPAHTQPYQPGDGKRVASYEEGVAAQTEALKTPAKRWAAMRARARIALGFDPNEPRDEHGRWTDGGGDGEAAPGLDPQVTEVGGDKWNRDTAKRLEREYQDAKPAMEQLAKGAVGTTVAVPHEEGEEGETPYVPESWEELGDAAQESVKQEFLENEQSKYLQSEINSWQESGGAMDDAKYQLAEETNHGHGPDHDAWLIDAINDNEFDPPIPYTAEQLSAAITLDYETGYEGNGPLTVTFDDAKLQDPSDKPPPPDPAQLLLPGFTPPPPQDYSKHLTPQMREDLTETIKEAFNEKAEKDVGDIEPPDYLQEQANEFMEQDWDGGMSDEQKFSYAKNNTSVVEDHSTGADPLKIDALPGTYDPLNKTSGTDYERTQALAHRLSVERTAEVLKARGLPVPDKATLTTIDSRLWRGWKQSSTQESGKLLQVATSDELGGRMNQKTAVEIDPDEMRKYAERQYPEIGGYDGVKAYVRAKWETTQYLLDKAGIKELNLYRGVKLSSDVYNKIARYIARHIGNAVEIGGLKHMPTLSVLRNGAASTSTDREVANGWGESSDNKITLRALVPRTAAISVPAYGQNIHSEREVVVAGTAWKGWDAWAGKAPPLENVPLRQAA